MLGNVGRCPNLGLEEPLAKKSRYSSFVEHQNTCKCTLDVNGSFLVADGTWRLPYARKVAETLIMRKREEERGVGWTISCPSVEVGEREEVFANRFSKNCL